MKMHPLYIGDMYWSDSAFWEYILISDYGENYVYIVNKSIKTGNTLSFSYHKYTKQHFFDIINRFDYKKIGNRLDLVKALNLLADEWDRRKGD